MGFELHFERRGLFSSDAAAYDTGRPGYPERVYELLVEVCGLGAGSDVLVSSFIRKPLPV